MVLCYSSHTNEHKEQHNAHCSNPANICFPGCLRSHSPAAEQAVVCRPHTENRTHHSRLDGHRGALQTHIWPSPSAGGTKPESGATLAGGQGRTTHHSRVTRGLAQTSLSGGTCATPHLRARYQRRHRWPAPCISYGNPRWSQTHGLQSQPSPWL